ncbi:uncharacterized protein M6G45_017802 isoform 2-T2 [Spheniscus humboldti]
MVQNTMMKQPLLGSFFGAGKEGTRCCCTICKPTCMHPVWQYPSCLSHPLALSSPEKMLGHAPEDASQGGNQPQLPLSPAARSWGAQRCLQMSMGRRSWLDEAAGTLLLLDWLAGDLPPPALFPNISSAQEGDLILAQCLVFSHVPITHIFFCKNRVELANHPMGKGQFTSILTIQLSAESSGTYSCGYQRRSSLGQVMLSRLSIPWLLTTGGGKDELRNGSIATSPELPSGGVSISLAFVVLSLLALALGIHLLLQIGKRTTGPVEWYPLTMPPIRDSWVHTLKSSRIRRH